MGYPLRFVDLKNYEAEDEIFKMAETLLDSKENVQLRARVNKKRIFTYILIKNLYPNIFQQLEAKSFFVVQNFNIALNKVDFFGAISFS